MVVVGVVALATAPAAAAPEFKLPLTWYDESPAAADTVVFEDVAGNPQTQVAVGADSATDTAAIYRRVAGIWQVEQLPATVTAGSALADVDVAPTGVDGWAVGRAGADPLVLHLGADGVWTDETAALLADGDADADSATAVAASGIGTATIGADEGRLFRVSAGQMSPTTPTTAPGAAEINGIELFGPTSGYTVASSTNGLPDGTPRIYELSAAGPVLEPAQPSPTTEVDIASLAATLPIQAVALDASGTTWHVNANDVWEPEPTTGLPADRELDAVGSVAEAETKEGIDGWATEFLVGAAGAPAEGALWRRARRWDHEPVLAWGRVTLPAGTPALTGVAATGWNDLWVAGGDGTILHYWAPPDPEAQAAWEEQERQRLAHEEAERQRLADEEAERERLADEEAERQRLADEERLRQEEIARQEQEAAQQQPPAEEAPAEERPSPPPPPPAPERDQFRMNGVVIDDPTAPQRNPPVGTRRLLEDVKAMRSGRRLIVTFRLTARARVSITAKRGARVIARTPMRTLRRGRRTLVLRFSGKPPSSLKVVVRRVRRR
jgi:hypothetical protein